MKTILICGAGSLGSLLTVSLASDLRDEHAITVLDFDKVAERNVRANTQAYISDHIGMLKVDALEYVVHKMNRKISVVNKKIETPWDLGPILGGPFIGGGDGTIETGVAPSPHLVVDCFDNQKARRIIQESCLPFEIPCVHVGFSPSFTWSILWNEEYQPPEDADGLDICELEGAASFVRMVAAFGSLVAQDFLKTGKKRELTGNRFFPREIV